MFVFKDVRTGSQNRPDGRRVSKAKRGGARFDPSFDASLRNPPISQNTTQAHKHESDTDRR